MASGDGRTSPVTMPEERQEDQPWAGNSEWTFPTVTQAEVGAMRTEPTDPPVTPAGMGIARTDWLRTEDVAEVATMEETPRNTAVAITPRQERTPERERQPSADEARIASAYKRLSGRQVSVANTEKELGWQQRAGSLSTISDRFRDKVLAWGPYLHIFVYMTEESPMLQVMHSIAKFFYIEAGIDLNNKIFGFVGDRTQYR
jgi:hypothetical protein